MSGQGHPLSPGGTRETPGQAYKYLRSRRQLASKKGRRGRETHLTTLSRKQDMSGIVRPVPAGHMAKVGSGMEWGLGEGRQRKASHCHQQKTTVSFHNVLVNVAGALKMRGFTFIPLSSSSPLMPLPCWGSKQTSIITSQLLSVVGRGWTLSLQTGSLGGRVYHRHGRDTWKICQEMSSLFSLHSCLSPELPALSPRTLLTIIKVLAHCTGLCQPNETCGMPNET